MTAPSQTTPRPSPSPAARDPIESLLRRGDEFLGFGDIAAARLFYERAAKAGSGLAAMLAGKTYDPLYFAEIGARGMVADRAKAMDWYSKAVALGDPEAKTRLERLRVEAQQ
jgi:TPR repeat protein